MSVCVCKCVHCCVLLRMVVCALVCFCVIVLFCIIVYDRACSCVLVYVSV